MAGTPRVDPGLVLSVLVAAEIPHVFSAFMPSVFTIRKFAEGERDRARLRAGYVPALLLASALGGSVSWLTNDRRPIIFTVAIASGMLVLYEREIRR